MTTETPYNRKAEQKRGFREATRQIGLLHSKWPKAFPANSHEVRPLTGNAKQALIETFGWTPAYARAVLMVWKLRPTYCQAVLRYATRINLDGSESAETVDDKSRAAATKSLEERAARRAKDAEKSRAAAVAREAESKVPEAAPATIVATKDHAQPKPPELPPAAIPEEQPETGIIAETTPPPEPPKSRKLLVAGSAAMEAALKRRLASGAMTTEVLKTVAAPSTSRKREQQAR